MQSVLGALLYSHAFVGWLRIPRGAEFAVLCDGGHRAPGIPRCELLQNVRMFRGRPCINWHLIDERCSACPVGHEQRVVISYMGALNEERTNCWRNARTVSPRKDGVLVVLENAISAIVES